MTEQSKPGVLPDYMLKIINGEQSEKEAGEAYENSLKRWWKEYAGRKNEEEEHVADTLLYDDRCHLPRTIPGPVFKEKEETTEEAKK